MLNTLKIKTFPKKFVKHHLTIVVRDAAVNVWSANMNVLHVARNEGLKVFNAVTQKTGTIKDRNVKALKITVEAANDKMGDGWTAVEKVLEARVIPLLGKLGLAAPAQAGVDLVGKGVARVSAKVVELTRARKPATKRMPARKAVTKRVGAAKARRAKAA